MFETRAALCGLAAQTLLNYLTCLHLLLILIFWGRNEKKERLAIKLHSHLRHDTLHGCHCWSER